MQIHSISIKKTRSVSRSVPAEVISTRMEASSCIINFVLHRNNTYKARICAVFGLGNMGKQKCVHLRDSQCSNIIQLIVRVSIYMTMTNEEIK